MVTEKMIERLAFYADHEDLSLELSGSPKACDDELQPLLKEVLAALSTDAEPVAIVSEARVNGFNVIIPVPEDAGSLPIGTKLFAAPPAPSVAVKALEWKEDGKYLRARMGDREYSVNITADGETWAGATRPYAFGKNLTWSSVPNCSMVSLETAKAACQADCQSRYAALSAQVQDVAGQDGTHLEEIADGAWGDDPATRGRARDELARRRAAVPAAKLEGKL